MGSNPQRLLLAEPSHPYESPNVGLRIRNAKKDPDGAGSCRERFESACFAYPLADMRQRFLDLVDQDQAKVAGLQAGKRRIDGDEFAGDGVDLLGAAGIGQTFAQQADHFAVFSTNIMRVHTLPFFLL